MMETKVWIALCALLLVHCGSSDEVHTAATASSYDQESVAPEAPAAAESTTEGETISVTLEIKKVANIVPPTEAAVLENKSTSQPSLLPSPTSHTPTTPTTTTTTTTSITPTTPTTTSITSTTTTTTTTTTTAGPTHTTHTTTTVDTPTTTPQTETTHHAALPDSATPSKQPTHNATLSPTSVPTPEPSKPETTTTSIITASSIPSTSSSQEAPSSEPSTLVRGGVVTLPPPQPTSQPDVHHEASSKAHPTHPVNPPSSPSAQAKDHAENPSQLNVGDDPTMVHDAPTLDPLLAGLVSAFIITAVIITLLLFLKLRRRDNRPEFRRLQDLPMDDMMEDTPLSMYSY